MKILASKSFDRELKRLLRRQPQFAESVRETIGMLATDPFQPRLKTHKLKGRLKDCWSCTVEFDIRIVFEIIRYEDEAALLLQTVGSHDNVY